MSLGAALLCVVPPNPKPPPAPVPPRSPSRPANWSARKAATDFRPNAVAATNCDWRAMFFCTISSTDWYLMLRRRRWRRRLRRKFRNLSLLN